MFSITSAPPTTWFSGNLSRTVPNPVLVVEQGFPRNQGVTRCGALDSDMWYGERGPTSRSIYHKKGGGCMNLADRHWLVPSIIRERDVEEVSGNDAYLDVVLFDKFRQFVHCDQVDLVRLNRNIGNTEQVITKYLQTRLDFLQNRLDLDTFRVRIQRIDKANQKTVEFNRICHTFVLLSLEVFDRLVTNPDMTKQQVLEELLEIRGIAVK